nr:MAG TPA: hypothetical protein [Caudoviricetes sp.]
MIRKTAGRRADRVFSAGSSRWGLPQTGLCLGEELR